MKIRRALTSAVACWLLVLTGCGGSGPTHTPTASPDADPIVIGSIQGAAYAKVARAWVDDINAHGGIGGRQVALISVDPADSSGIAAARMLVDEKHVVAIVGYTDPTVSTWGPYVAANNVPVIGGLPIDLIATSNPDFFPIGSNIFAAAYGMVAKAKTLGPRLGLLYCAENTQCQGVQQLLEFLGGSLGVELAASAKVATTGATDYTDACQALIDGNVQSYTVAADGPVVVKIADRCASMGLDARFVATGGTVRTLYLDSPSLDGALIADSTAPFVDDSVPATRKYQDLIADLDLFGLNGPVTFYTYASFELFKKAVENAAVPNGEAVTSEDLRNGLYQMKEETLGGITPPLTFERGKPTLVNCYFTMSVSDGQFVTPHGLETDCAPDDVIDLLVELADAAS